MLIWQKLKGPLEEKTLWKEILRDKPLCPSSYMHSYMPLMYGCESWTIKKAEWQWIDAFELWYWRRLLRVFGQQEIHAVHPNGDQSWVFIGRTGDKAETPILWPPHAKSWLIWKDPDAGKDWGQEEKGMTEMVGWHHWLDGHGFGWTLGVGDGQGGLACCGSWGHKELDTTERLIWYDWRRLMWIPWTARRSN